MALTEKEIQHIDQVFAELEKVYYTEEREEQLTDIFLFSYEIMLTNPSWDYTVLNRTLFDLKYSGIPFTYQAVSAHYPQVELTMPHLLQKNIREFRFFIYVNHPSPDFFTLLGYPSELIKEVALQTVLKEYARLWANYADSQAALTERENSGYRFLSCRIRSHSLNDAFNSFHEWLSLWKGILEYSFSKGKSSYAGFRTVSRVVSRFSIPEFVLVYDNENYTCHQLERESGVKPVKESEAILPADALKLLDLFSVTPSIKSITRLIQKSLSLYNQAMDSVYRSGSFQLFWNILEEVTLSIDTNGKTEEVIRRLCYYEPENYHLFEKLFSNLKTTRNELIHKGVDNTNDVHVAFVKRLSEHCIKHIIDQRTSIDTIHKLRIALRIMHHTDSQLTEELAVLQLQLTKEKDTGTTNP